MTVNYKQTAAAAQRPLDSTYRGNLRPSGYLEDYRLAPAPGWVPEEHGFDGYVDLYGLEFLCAYGGCVVRLLFGVPFLTSAVTANTTNFSRK